VCRQSAGVCDIEEKCDGTTKNCPANAYQPDGTACNDLLWCNTGENCQSGVCAGGSARDCSDGEECTSDNCNENLDQCQNANLPQGTSCGSARDCPADGCSGYIAQFYPTDGHDACDGSGDCTQYACAMETSYCTDNDHTDGVDTLECNAPCDQNNDCAATECDNLDGCIGNDYYDYSDVANSCQAGCTCTANVCGAPVIHYDDPICGGCQSDNDCNTLDDDYCDGTTVKHDEGRCV
jgi:hypothetical protein